MVGCALVVDPTTSGRREQPSALPTVHGSVEDQDLKRSMSDLVYAVKWGYLHIGRIFNCFKACVLVAKSEVLHRIICVNKNGLPVMLRTQL